MPITKRKIQRKIKIFSPNGNRTVTIHYRRPGSDLQQNRVSANIPTTSTDNLPINIPNEFNTEETPSTSTSSSNNYQKKKQQTFDNWSKIKDPLIDIHIEELSPPTFECQFCLRHDENIIFCFDCGPLAFYCSDCCIKVHKTVCLHSPQQWQGEIYVPFNLPACIYKRLDKHECESQYISPIYVVDVKGSQHQCSITLCHCEEPPITLMRYRLWAASPQKPRIAFDIRFMELLRVLQLEAHLPAKGFCDALDHLDNDFIHNSEHFPKDIYRAVIGDCLREYLYHSSLLKTRYTYHESTIGRECPICRREPSLISFDANFGLVHKKSSGDGHGKTAARHNDFLFVDPSKFKNFIEDYNVDKGSYVNDCSNFQAGSLVRSKSKNAKLDVKGLFGSICKHDIPYLFIDMEYGERLGYAVFIMDKLLEENESKTVLMYDIACMLHKHLMKNKRNDLLDKFSFAVPVFHSFAHNMQCQLKYGQKFMDDCGLTDGEGIERLWSYLRRFKSITKEMSYDNRVDLLTEALIHNSEKIISNMGPRLHSKLCKAEKIIKDSPFKNQEELSQAGTWLQNWKKDTESKNTKGNELNSTEKFVECVHKIKTISTSVGVMHYDANKEALITSLRTEMSKLKNVDKHIKEQGEDLSFETEAIKQKLLNAQNKRQCEILLKLRNLAIEREYIGSMMKKYADGQTLALRIGKQFSSNTSKMKNLLDILNKNHNVGTDTDFSMVSSPTSEIYKKLHENPLDEKKQQAALSYSSFKHAEEESELIKAELQAFYTYLNEQLKQIDQSSQVSKDLSNMSRYHKGMLQYLVRIRIKINKILKKSKPSFDYLGITEGISENVTPEEEIIQDIQEDYFEDDISSEDEDEINVDDEI